MCVGYIDGAPNEGATVVVDGRESVPADGYFVNPTLTRQRDAPSMASYRDEIFGPVLGVMRVSGFEEGIDIDQRQPVRQRHGDLHP